MLANKRLIIALFIRHMVRIVLFASFVVGQQNSEDPW